MHNDYVGGLEALFIFPRNPTPEPPPAPPRQLFVWVIMRRRALTSGMTHYIKQDLVFAIIIRIYTQQTECFKIYFHFKILYDPFVFVHLITVVYLEATIWYNLLISIEYIFQVIATLHCVLQLSKKLNNVRNDQEHVHKTMWKKFASLQSEAELCAIFKKKDNENKGGSQSFKDFLIILRACVSKTTIHLSVEAKRDTQKRLKIPRISSDATLYLPVL